MLLTFLGFILILALIVRIDVSAIPDPPLPVWIQICLVIVIMPVFLWLTFSGVGLLISLALNAIGRTLIGLAQAIL